MATSYSNPGGSGNRTASITVTASGFVGTPSSLVNGTTTVAADAGWFNAGMTAPVQFAFGTPKVIDEAKYYQDLSTTHGTWKWQGSPDGSSWTDIGGSFTLGGSTTQTISTLAGNTTAYPYYRLANVSGAASSAAYALEFDFKIDTPPATATVPTVIGMTTAAANTALVAVGLVTGTVTSQPSTATAGTVISQSPAAGASAALGSAVNLVVAVTPGPGVAPVRVNFVQATQWNVTSGATFASPAQNISAGNTLVVCVGGNAVASQFVTGVTDTAGNSYSKIAHVYDVADPYRQEVWIASNIAIHAANVVTATWSAALEYRGIVVIQYAGLDPVTPLDDTKQYVGVSPYTTPTLTGTTAESVHLLMARWGIGSTVFPAGFTEFTTAGAGVPEVADKIVTGGAFTGTYTVSSSSTFVIAVILKTTGGAVTPGLIIRINGVIWKFRHDSLAIHSTLNGHDRLSGIIDILDDTDPPTLNQDITVEEDGVRIFGGRINELEYRAITSDPDASKDLMVSLDAEDFNAIADTRTVASLTLPEGSTLKQALVLLVAELAPYGVTLSTTQVDGPAMPSLNFTLQTATAVLDELSKLTEYVWEIDYYKVLTMWQPGSVAAPFNITDGDQKVWGDIVIRPIASEYANRIIVRSGPNAPLDHVAAWPTDGVINAFGFDFQVLHHYGQVLVDTPLETVPGESWESLGPPGSGSIWEFHDAFVPGLGGQYFTRAAGPPAAGNPWPTVPYPIQVKTFIQSPVIATADDLAEQALNGIVERVVDLGANITGLGGSNQIADSLLARHVARRYTIQFSTREQGLRVGQSITIAIARRNLDGPYFITDVETRMVGATLLKRTVTANETELFQGSWRDTYKLWAGESAGGGGGSTTVGTTIPVGGSVVPHHVMHEPGGDDPLTVDGTASIGSLRTLGTGANQAAPGSALANYLLRADVDEVIRIGTRAAQPAATAVLAGTLYCLTDERNAVERSTGSAWESFVRRRHVAIFAYDYSSTTTAPPASTTVRFNAAAPYTTVTKVYVHVQTNDGRDVYLGLMGTDTGARVTIQDKNDHTVYATFTVTGTPVDHTTYIEWPVAYVANGGASLFNNQAVLVMKQ